MAIPLGAQLFGGVFAGVMSVVGVLGNATTLWAIGRNKKLRKQPTTVLMLSLIIIYICYYAVQLPFTSLIFLNCW